MKKSQPPTHQIELRIVELSELFNSMDPTPFHHRNLDPDAEDFLESWALGFPQDSHFKIIVHIEKMHEENPSALVAEAIHNYFEYKSERSKHNLQQLPTATTARRSREPSDWDLFSSAVSTWRGYSCCRFHA